MFHHVWAGLLARKTSQGDKNTVMQILQLNVCIQEFSEDNSENRLRESKIRDQIKDQDQAATGNDEN